MQRKTIKGAQREALYDWIQEELSILESNPFNPVKTNHLREAFNQAMLTDVSNQPAPDDIPAEVLDAFLDDLERMVGHEVKLSNEELMDMLGAPHKFQTYLEQLLADKREAENVEDEEGIDWGTDDFFTDDSPHYGFDEPSSTASKALYSDKQMTKLYRQLAKQLRSDKETDVSKKVVKSALMQQLSQAKKAKDVVALLLMAQQYLPDHEMVMDADMLARLQATLKEKVAQLSLEYRELQHGDDLKNIIWRKFGGGNQASRQRGLSKYRSILQQEAQELSQRCQDLKTVKQIRQCLTERIDAARFHNTLLNIDPSEFFGAEDDRF